MDKLYTLLQETYVYCISSSISIRLLMYLKEARKKVPNYLPPIFVNNGCLSFTETADRRTRVYELCIGNKQAIFATSCKSIHLP